MGQNERLMYRIAGDLRDVLFELQMELSGGEHRNYPDMSREAMVSAACGGMIVLRRLYEGRLSPDEYVRLFPCSIYAD